jgi:uncharacterized protein
MAITRQLFELQELDNDIENTRQTLELKSRLVNNREALDKASALLASEQKTLEELKHQRRNAETEASDINAKINETNKQLYGGRVSNSKELSNLQAEVNQLTGQKDLIETNTLDIIDKLEAVETRVKTLTDEYKKMEINWGSDQAQLVKDTALLTKTLAALQESRKETITRIEPQTLALYERIRKLKKQAVAKVERGICQSCRISLSVSSLQKARGGQPVQCNTCGKILFVS